MRSRSASTLVAIVGALALVLAACGDDGDDGGGDGGSAAGSASTTTTVVEVEVAQVLVTNDDGVGAAGIDAVVTALEGRDDVEITVVAPAGQQTGASDQTSPQPPAAEEATTASGIPAIAVDGFPADAVNYALGDEVDTEFDLVVSGLNEGQNVGVARNLSGTVGAAATAARAGVAGLSASQGLVAASDAEPDYEPGVEQVMAWLDENLEAAVAGELAGTLESLNVPTCTAGEVRGLAEVPPADDNEGQFDQFTVDCTSELEDPADDVEAFTNGFATLTELDPAVTGQSVQ